MRIFPENKKGASMVGWTEGILLSVLLVIALGIAITGMNGLYSKNYDVGLGTNSTTKAFADYQDTLNNQIKGGEVNFNSVAGMTLGSSWEIIKSGIMIIWDFLTGGWIETIVAYMYLPSAVALIFRMLYFLSIGFIILRILFKVKP